MLYPCVWDSVIIAFGCGVFGSLFSTLFVYIRFWLS